MKSHLGRNKFGRENMRSSVGEMPVPGSVKGQADPGLGSPQMTCGNEESRGVGGGLRVRVGRRENRCEN